jgi:preprotein translocase subunit SecD
MTWRRIAPWVIGVIALMAIFISLPRTTLGIPWLPDEILGAEFRTVLGLDLEGGLRVTLEVEPEPGQEITDADLELTRDVIERRVAGIGVNEPVVRSEIAGDGSRRIIVEVPGVSDQSQVRSLVGSTGRLQFVDPQGQSLTEEQDITDLLASGAVRELVHPE